METRSARRRRLSVSADAADSGHDYITHLPDAVLHHILSLLPIKTIARIATLSARWRHLWLTLPDLDFDSAAASGVIAGILNARDHTQSNLRLLRFSATIGFSRLNGLLRAAVRHRIQELHLQISTRDHFNFPRCIIASDSLKIFTLRSTHLGFHLPPSAVMSGGFRSLHTLSLARVQLDRCSVLDLFTHSSFPLLKKLNLESCHSLRTLRVHCPVLEDFSLEGCLELLGLDVFGARLERLRICGSFDPRRPSWVKIGARNLKRLVWVDNGVTDEVCLEDDLGSIDEVALGLCSQHFPTKMKIQSVSVLLHGVSTANSLTFETSFVDVLSSNNYFTCHLPAFNNVKSMELRTVFKKHNVPGLANIFKSCPILHTLTIKIIHDISHGRKDWRRDKWERIISEEEQFWETQIELLKSFLVHLKVVRIEGFMECLDEVVRLIQFLLKHGTSLQQLSILTAKSNLVRRRLIKSQILGFSRASSDVKLQYC